MWQQNSFVTTAHHNSAVRPHLLAAESLGRLYQHGLKRPYADFRFHFHLLRGGGADVRLALATIHQVYVYPFWLVVYFPLSVLPL